jgi:putative transposase
MRNHFHIVLETPEANLVSGMRWLLSCYTIRYNARHKLFGHVFSGRYKAQVVDSSGDGYFRTACDYVHLNPVRAKLLKPDQRLISYPWSSLLWYMAAPEHRPAWIRVDRVLGEHGLKRDTADSRQEFERRMETRRRWEDDEKTLAPLRRGWCLGSDEFRKRHRLRMRSKLGENHAGELHRQSAETKAEQIIKNELKRRRWPNDRLKTLRKGDPGKMQIAARVRSETTLTLKWIAARLNLGTSKSANMRLHLWMKNNAINPKTQTNLTMV